MIPSVKILIDQANNAIVENGDGDHHGQRINLPPAEIAKLIEFRSTEKVRRSQEKKDSTKSLEVPRAKASCNVNPIQLEEAIDEQRAFGFPQGEANFELIWKMWDKVFEHVYDMKDIRNLINTCRLFRKLIEGKYAAPLLPGIALDYFKGYWGFKVVLNLRGVSKSSKAVVDEWILKDRLPWEWYMEELNIQDVIDWIPKPCLELWPSERGLHRLQSLMTSLQQSNVYDAENDTFPLRDISLCEIGANDLDPENPIIVIDANELNNPRVSILRNEFQRLLELVGWSFRRFRYNSKENNVVTYNHLRSWMALMPNLEDLTVGALGEYFAGEEIENPPPAQEFLEFPSCPKLKRYTSKGVFCVPFVAEIFRANPSISDVHIYFDGNVAAMDMEEFTTVLQTLNILRLKRFIWFGKNQIPPAQFLEFRFQWPLKYLTLRIEDWDDGQHPETPSGIMFSFVNSFRETLKEVVVTLKMRDTGGFLDLPKASKVLWKLWPEFKSLEFLIPLDRLKLLDLDLTALDWENGSFEDIKTFLEQKNLLFPELEEMRVKVEEGGDWVYDERV